MDTAKKQGLLKRKAEKYKTKDIVQRQELLNKQAERYKTRILQRKQNYSENPKTTTIRVKIKLQIHSSNNLKRQQRKVLILYAVYVAEHFTGNRS